MDIFSAFGKSFGFGEKTTIIAQSDTGEKRMIVVDATPFENHKNSSKVTEFEIEDGSNIGDHVVRKGVMLELQGVVSDSPITIANAIVSNVTGIAGVIASKTTGFSQRTNNLLATGTSILGGVIANLGVGKPSKDAQDAFDEIQEKGLPLTIITGLKTYVNMILEDYSATVTPQTAGALNFNCSFKEVRTVTSEEVLVPIGDIVNGGAQEQDAGEKQAVLDSATDPDNRTGLLTIVQDGFGALTP